MNKAILTLGIVSVWGVAGCSTWQIYNSNADVIKTDTQLKMIEADVDKTYASLDDALQIKDIPGFVTKYEEARQFASALQDDTDTGVVQFFAEPKEASSSSCMNSRRI